MATTTHPRHLSRKELRQPTEVASFVEAAGDYVANHLMRVVLGAVGLLALVLIAAGVRLYLAQRDGAIAESFYQATRALEHKDYSSATAQFTRVSQDYPGSSLGRLALFYVGNAYLAQDQFAKARDALQEYLAVGDRPTFREMALMQLGVADENLGDYPAARKAYGDASAIAGPQQANADLNIARLLVRLGDKPGAVAAYQRYLREHPLSDDRNTVIDALAQLGVAPAMPSGPGRTITIPPAK